VITGILPVDKPLGWTSHDVVARVRRLAGQKQVGHAGTLDPLATGVLLVMLGQATRLSPYLMDSEKAYCAEVVLGATTATDDGEAPLETWTDPAGISLDEIDVVLARFRGPIRQVPPRYAAVRQGGEKLYVRARRGEAVQAEPRTVLVHEITVRYWEPPRLRLWVRCAAGTYIRSLARDIGAALGVGGYLHALRRTRSGSFPVTECVPLASLDSREDLLSALKPPDRAVVTWPAVALSADGAAAIHHGRAVPLGRPRHGSMRVYDPAGRLIALAEGGEQIKPFRVFEGVADARGD
jgi:tRNA pseudouridine55 synthase